MDPQMQQKCDNKLRELQKCMPFLLRVLERLKNNKNDLPRQTQLEKIQKLYNLLNDKTQIFKWDLLVKCENVIQKLQRKMEIQGETEIVKENTRSSSSTELNGDDLGCPESPPMQQQMEYCDKIQPVVIPTERRCSPPPSISNNHREKHEPSRRETNGERKDRKHTHTSRHHHKHRKHEHQRSDSKEDKTSLKDECFIRRDRHNAPNEDDQNAIIDRYLSAQRRREEGSRDRDRDRESCWQRRSQSREIWPQKPSTYESNNSNMPDDFSTKHKSKARTGVFARLGEKVKDCANDNMNERLTTNNNQSLSKPYTTPNQLTMSAKETLPTVSDFLKIPPLTANDITQLLNESNSNSNSNSSDLLSISEIGTRRNTKATSTISYPTTTHLDSKNASSLDMVRKKFALLTKTDTASVSSPKSNEVNSVSNALTQNEQKQTTPTLSAERLAFRNYAHSRSTNNSVSSSPSSPTIVPNTNVNVLPTFRPNDPRLRKSNIANESTSTLPMSTHLPSLLSLPTVPPSPVKPVHLLSPISNATAMSNTPSPIYGNISAYAHSSPIPIPMANIFSNQAKINDPRLQRSRTSSTLHTVSTQKRNLLVPGDSSDENWDLDDNARDIFPKPRPFPNQNPTHSQGNSTYNVIPRPSAVWDRVSQPIKNAITPPNRITNNANLQGSIPHIEDPKSFHNKNWHSGSAAAPTMQYNATSFTHSNDLQNNVPTEYSNYSAPRTYGAYKQARARAEAEQAAARKSTECNRTQKETFETEKVEKNKDSNEAESKLHGNNNLDTTYRNKNLPNCELPKTIENFKIPKKPVVLPSTENEIRSETKTTAVKQVEDITPSKSTEHKSSKRENIETKKACLDLITSSKSTTTTTTAVKDNMEPPQPKTQRLRFTKKQKDQINSKFNENKSPKKTISGTFEEANWIVLDEVAGTDSEPELIINEELSPQKRKESVATSPKLDFMATQPCRIIKRRCTMIDKASAPEVDKEKLLKTNAMLFEDLQERERKNKTEAANKVHTPNRRHGEICYDRTDDGCTVSTQNILTGKRRTRTTANFNEVQRAKAIFKQLKSSETTKKDTIPTTATISPTVQPTKERKKPGPKPKIKPEKKVEQEKRTTIDAQVEEGDSNKDKKDKKAQKIRMSIESKPKLKKEEEKTEKTEKSATLPNVTSIFDTFIQKILNPATNADELINKLRDILSEQEVEALLSLREAMLKKHLTEHATGDTKDTSIVEHKQTSVIPIKEIESANKSVEVKTDYKEEKVSADNVDKKELSQTETEQAHMKPKAPRRNELDRLHEDIRDMFISEGVLTATGKRMCTFVEPCPTKQHTESEQNNTSNSKNEKVSVSLSAPTRTTSPQSMQNRFRKPRIMLRALKMPSESSHKSARQKEVELEAEEDIDENAPNDTSFSSDTTQLSSTTATTLSTESTEKTDTATALSSSTKSDDSLRPLPVLKPLKPIRLREEDELDEWLANQKDPTAAASKSEKQKKKRYKPCPKSKKPPDALVNDNDDDADVEDTTTDIEMISVRPKIKTELLDITVPYEDVNANTKDNNLKKPIKNINPKWHFASKYAQKCVVCKQKASYISSHYKKKHHSENYVSRLAPIILEQLKKQDATLNRPFLKFQNKKSNTKLWLYRCPFCLQFKHSNFFGWLEHFITHTGEYIYECTLCRKSFNKPNLIERHMKEKCAGLGGRYLHNDEINRSLKDNEIKAYVCRICNFVRLGRSGLEHHYMEQHDYDVKSINDSIGYTISLMATENVPVAKKLEELIQMETKLIKQFQTDIISLTDDVDHDHDYEIKEKSDSAMERTKSPIADSTNEKPNTVAQQDSSSIKTKFVTKEQPQSTVQTLCEKIASKENAEKSQTIVDNTLKNNTSEAILTQQNTANEVSAIAKQAAPVSSVFVSTTDDSNDGEVPTIFAKKLLTADDETDLCNKSSPKPKPFGAISMAERLSQRLKKAEANTLSSSAQQQLKEIDVNTASAAIQPQQKNVESNKDSTSSQELLPSEQTEPECTVQHTIQTDHQSKGTESSKNTSVTEPNDKSDEGEVDFTNEEDDDGWEDIEIVETAPSAVTVSNSTNQATSKETKTQRNKKNPLQKFSRLYATMAPNSKSHKSSNSKGFKPLLTIFSSLNSANKETNETVKEISMADLTTKTSTENTTTLTTTTTSISSNLSIPTLPSTSEHGFRPMIANLADLLPDSPLNDPIEMAPELAPSSPLQELNDLTSFLGTNLSGLMDIDVEDPANSVCIHNADNQQTSIQEALDFIATQTSNYDEPQAHNHNKQFDSNNTSDCLSPAPMSVNRIQNIGYTLLDTTNYNSKAFKFYCFSDRCTFLYSSEAIGLENHFLLEHPQSKWNGYCNTCAYQIKVCPTPLELNFSDEFSHLLEVHVKQSNLSSQTLASTDATLSTELQEEISNCLTDEQPRLKLRRLSGDCLSTATVQSGSSNNTFVESSNDEDSTSFSDLIRFNPPLTKSNSSSNQLVDDTLIPTSLECISNDVPYFTNISKDFEITSISSGLEPNELSAIVKSALNVKASSKNTDATNPCTLQISNVVSLSKSVSKDISSTHLPAAESTELSLPKITNVCSLNSSSAATNIGALWSKQISQDRIELAQSAAESMEISAFLENESRKSKPSKQSMQTRINNESPGPMVVSETLPVGQATSGNFVITQTVSAQYSEENAVGGCTNRPKLGFNISISSAATGNETSTSTTSSPATSTSVENLKPLLNCMETNCKYSTRHLVAIIDHVKWHETQNDPTKHEYLRCSLCKLKLLTVEAYTQHLRIEHFSAPAPVAELSSSSPITSCALTNKIRNLLTHNHVEITAKEVPISTKNSSLSKQNLNDESDTFKARLLETITEMVSKTGMSENKLFRCVIKDCNVKLNESSYHTHVLYHLSTFGGVNNTFPCPHCKGKFSNISALKTHIKVNHIRHNIICYLCMETAANDIQMSRHFAQKHWQKKELNTSIIAQCESHDGDSSTALVYYVTNSSPLTENNIRDFSMKLVTEWQRKKAATRTHFNPDEIELLPIQAIFSKDIFCALCLYKTKVRTNMIRHMMQHKNTATVSDNGVAASTNSLNHIQKDGSANENTGNVMMCSMDPVNPVPCLISNEKHFDRMTNLASSSLGPIVPQGASATNTTIGSGSSITTEAICKLRYNYIPQSKRFKCGVLGCEYLTIYEDTFRSHLHALHSDERSYQCLFCKEDLCKRNLVEERIVQHLRFHNSTLYQCEQCDHSHYLRHLVERHALEKHGPVSRANILMFVRDEEGSLEGTKKVFVAYGKKQKDASANDGITNGNPNIPSENTAENTSATGKNAANHTKNSQKLPKFICDLCQHTTFTYNQLTAHCSSQHGIKQPYQCAYCFNFTAWSEQNVETHINEEHPGELLKVNRIFGKMSIEQQREFLMQTKNSNLIEQPLKPLWQRDDPKRARQIRGIPMEDEEDSEKLRKRLRLNDDYYDEEYGDGSGDSYSGNSDGQSASNLYLNRFEFGCFHCEYKTNSIEELKSVHWESVHKSGDISASKPFLFRLLVRLKCAECENFNGCFWELQRHMTEDHAKPTSHAADPRAKKIVCGYCDYDCSNATQLLRHHLREDHQPQDIKALFSIQMAKVMRLDCTSAVNYVHCSLCSELFNSRLAVVQHAGEKHIDDTEHFSFRELTNTTIYRCSECQYTATDELTTLRHMINHYRRFKRCNFCNLPQTSFNEYMQHCYSDHRTEIRRFSNIYPLNDIRKFLMQVLIIFPNGWIINKKNLRNTPYGNEERIKKLYAEICKTSQEPPIPRLSLGRLVARKSIEAKQQQQLQPDLQSMFATASVLQLAGNGVSSTKKQLAAHRITKRRCTIAVGNGNEIYTKKQKISTHIMTNPNSKIKPTIRTKTITKSDEKLVVVPYSFYGQLPETEQWDKLHTKVCLAGSVQTLINLEKFKSLVNINAYVKVEKSDIQKYKLQSSISNNKEKEEKEKADPEVSLDACENINQYEHVKKACPASQKYRFI